MRPGNSRSRPRALPSRIDVHDTSPIGSLVSVSRVEVACSTAGLNGAQPSRDRGAMESLPFQERDLRHCASGSFEWVLPDSSTKAEAAAVSRSRCWSARADEFRRGREDRTQPTRHPYSHLGGRDAIHRDSCRFRYRPGARSGRCSRGTRRMRAPRPLSIRDRHPRARPQDRPRSLPWLPGAAGRTPAAPAAGPQTPAYRRA